MPEITETTFAADRETWRRWLQQHHAVKQEIWLLFYKKHTRKQCVTYDAAVEEALCFGWIDGLLKRIDGEQHVIRFTPRRKRSIWSESNKRRVQEMIRQGRMTEAGLKLVTAAKQSGQWDRAAAREKEPAVPPDLAQALASNSEALHNFNQFAPSQRKMYVWWVLDAKRQQTRRRRIQEVVRRAARNQKPGT